MNSKFRNNVVKLLGTLENLEGLVRQVDPDRIPYFVSYLERMRCNLETYEKIGCLETENILKVVKRDWIEAKDGILGIPERSVPDFKNSDEPEDAFKFLEYIMTIDSLIKQEKEQK